jgi:tetratricopeptide (TPR) repeat protein
LEVLDRVLDQIGDYLPEEDPLILAVGGLIAERFPESAWLFQPDDVSLSIDVTTVMAGDGLTHELLLPFGAARERLAGRFRLTELTKHPTHKLPTFLVDNLRSPVLEAVANRLAREAAIGDRELSGTASYRTMLERYPDADPILLQAASSVARLRSDSLMQLIAAWGLVGWEPLSPEANGLLARAAYASCEPAEYERLLRLSCELAPEDQELRFLWADSLMILDRVDEAEEEYRRAVRLDKDGVLQNHLEGRLRMIEKLKGEATSP